MSALRRWGAAVVAATLATLLVACGGLPTSGPVNAGQAIPDDTSNNDVVFIPDGPAKDATPEQIVQGFIAAGSGPTTNWATARLFLAPDLADEWDPRETVTVYSPGERNLQQVSDTQFMLSVAPVATVDSIGELTTGGASGDISLQYSLAQQPDGQWRITQAPPGIVLDRNRFQQVFGKYLLQFFDPTWTYLVPDERWFPRLYAPTSIASALVNGGPSPWLVDSVATAFVDGARLAQPSVPVRSGKAASVSLQEGARSLDATALDRMQTQLFASLQQAGIDEVDMYVDEQLLAANTVTTRQTRVDGRPLVRTADAFGFVSGAAVESIPGLSDAILQVDAADIEVDADRASSAVRDTLGAVWRVTADDTRTRLDARPGLIAPSIDPLGYVWSVPQASPSAVWAFAADGTRIDVQNAWGGVSEIVDQRVSRDGTRIAAIVRDGGGYALWVAGIVRDRSGVPTGFGERRVLALLPAGGTALTWADASTVSLITAEDGDPILLSQEVGGFDETQGAPTGITTAAGGTQSGGIRLRDAAGELYTPRGANWQHLASGVDVLAIQQGMPR